MFDIFQKEGCVIWLTGLPAAGKTTIAQAIMDLFESNHVKSEWLDGDKIREFFPLSGFTKPERTEHIHRVGFTAGLLAKHGVNTVVSLVSPYEESRKLAQQHAGNFFLIHISTPQNVCERRDPKGLYKRARSGEIKNFTGVSDEFEIPSKPFLKIDSTDGNIREKALIILTEVSKFLRKGLDKK